MCSDNEAESYGYYYGSRILWKVIGKIDSINLTLMYELYEFFAFSQLEKNRNNKAIKSFIAAIKLRELVIGEKLKKDRRYMGIVIDKAYIYYCKNDLQDAEKELLGIISFISDNNYKPVLDYLKVHRLLYKIYMESHKYDQAIETIMKCIDLCKDLDESDCCDRINMGMLFSQKS